MEKMEYIKLKSILAGIGGTGSSLLGWLSSSMLHGLLSNLLLIASFIPVVISVWYIRKIHKHKNNTAAIKESIAQLGLCHECRRGKEYEPVECPIEPEHRPGNCPKMKRREQTKGHRTFLQRLGDEESTT
jgi:hypothetical protein